MSRSWIVGIIYMIVMISCKNSDSDIIIDIDEVINKSNDEVIGILGKPDTAYWQPIFNKKVYTTVYTPYKVEFRYFNGVASDIIVRQPGDLSFHPASLARFGIPKSDPDKREPNVLLRWDHPTDRIRMITMYAKKAGDDGQPSVYEFYFKGRE